MRLNVHYNRVRNNTRNSRWTPSSSLRGSLMNISLLGSKRGANLNGKYQWGYARNAFPTFKLIVRRTCTCSENFKRTIIILNSATERKRFQFHYDCAPAKRSNGDKLIWSDTQTFGADNVSLCLKSYASFFFFYKSNRLQN